MSEIMDYNEYYKYNKIFEEYKNTEFMIYTNYLANENVDKNNGSVSFPNYKMTIEEWRTKNYEKAYLSIPKKANNKEFEIPETNGKIQELTEIFNKEFDELDSDNHTTIKKSIVFFIFKLNHNLKVLKQNELKNVKYYLNDEVDLSEYKVYDIVDQNDNILNQEFDGLNEITHLEYNPYSNNLFISSKYRNGFHKFNLDERKYKYIKTYDIQVLPKEDEIETFKYNYLYNKLYISGKVKNTYGLAKGYNEIKIFSMIDQKEIKEKTYTLKQEYIGGDQPEGKDKQVNKIELFESTNLKINNNPYKVNFILRNNKLLYDKKVLFTEPFLNAHGKNMEKGLNLPTYKRIGTHNHYMDRDLNTVFSEIKIKGVFSNHYTLFFENKRLEEKRSLIMSTNMKTKETKIKEIEVKQKAIAEELKKNNKDIYEYLECIYFKFSKNYDQILLFLRRTNGIIYYTLDSIDILKDTDGIIVKTLQIEKKNLNKFFPLSYDYDRYDAIAKGRIKNSITGVSLNNNFAVVGTQEKTGKSKLFYIYKNSDFSSQKLDNVLSKSHYIKFKTDPCFIGVINDMRENQKIVNIFVKETNIKNTFIYFIVQEKEINIIEIIYDALDNKPFYSTHTEQQKFLQRIRFQEGEIIKKAFYSDFNKKLIVWINSNDTNKRSYIKIYESINR
jgi:hypothetical protein